MLTPEQFLKVLDLGFPLSPPPMVGNAIAGRIIRGKVDADFEKLSDDPSRKIVFLTDAAGLAKMLGKSGYEMLITVGHHPDHIKKQLSDGKSYKIVVFPASSAYDATWDGLLKVTGEVYPDLVPDLRNHAGVFKSSKYDLFESAAGYKFHDVDDPTNPRFMSYDAYVASSRLPWELRAFMYHVLHIKELFRGDGYTYDENGKRGVREFLMANKNVSDIPGAVVGDIQVSLP
jgi:hypothetical protein